MFQFLLGTLKTLQEPLQSRETCQVSIPFRYAENLSSLYSRMLFKGVSIPFRYAENTEHKRSPLVEHGSFNSF